MRLRTLKRGILLTSDITIDTPLESHRGIATYFATHKKHGHVLVHLLPDFDESAESPIKILERAVSFYRDTLHLEAGCGVYEELLYFWEPFPLGEYMFEWLERRERVVRSEAIKRIIALLKTLDEAHAAGLFHGRITPKSVLMERTGDAFGIRLMGLGVSQAMIESMQFDIDWLDYMFDLEGMDSVDVDIFGIAIILMGLVCGESGIDSFEQTGLLPMPFRDGMLQTAMERALALRVDAYDSILAFTQDLEAALLEIDGKEGEMYVGDLVGYESAIRSVTSVTRRTAPDAHDSGAWSSLVDTLEGDEKSSLLCSLTSLAAIPAIKDDEDEADVTHVSSVPDSVLMMRRIRSGHAEKASESEVRAKKLRAQNGDYSGEDDSTNRSGTPEAIGRKQLDAYDKKLASIVSQEIELEPEDSQEHTCIDHIPLRNSGTVELSPSAQKKLAQIQSLEAETDVFEGEDESPTRVMTRPNYLSVSPKDASKQKTIIEAAKDETIDGTDKRENPVKKFIEENHEWKERILKATVKEAEFEIGIDVHYADADCAAIPDPNAPVVSQPPAPVDKPAEEDSKPSGLEVKVKAVPAHQETVRMEAPRAPRAVAPSHQFLPGISSAQRKALFVMVIIVLLLIIMLLYTNITGN